MKKLRNDEKWIYIPNNKKSDYCMLLTDNTSIHLLFKNNFKISYLLSYLQELCVCS